MPLWSVRTLAILFALCSGGTDARIIDRTLLPTRLIAGGHCDPKPDEVIPAPGTETGTVDHNLRGFDFVVEGDILPIAYDFAIVRFDPKGLCFPLIS